jgi:hypothetical protein
VLPIFFHSFVTPFGHPPDTGHPKDAGHFSDAFNLSYIFFLSQTILFGYFFDVSLRVIDKESSMEYYVHHNRTNAGA